MFFSRDKTRLPRPEDALPGRSVPMPVPVRHAVLDAPLDAPFEGLERAIFGMGCFWGAERAFWTLSGVVSTAVGYAAGFTPHPTYEEVCSGRTGHNEVVRVIFDPARIGFDALLKVFWERHDPTQGMRQGNDVGTQYRSGVYVFGEAQRALASESAAAYDPEGDERSQGGRCGGLGHVSTLAGSGRPCESAAEPGFGLGGSTRAQAGRRPPPRVPPRIPGHTESVVTAPERAAGMGGAARG
jgi:peptide-methionine (S)-S-oxide reductase